MRVIGIIIRLSYNKDSTKLLTLILQKIVKLKERDNCLKY